MLAYACKSDYSPTTANVLDANALRSSIWLPVFLSVTGGIILCREVRERIGRGDREREETKNSHALLSPAPINFTLLTRAHERVIATRYNDQTHCPQPEWGTGTFLLDRSFGPILRLEYPRICTREECSVRAARTRFILLSEPRYASLSSAKRPFHRADNTSLWPRPLWRKLVLFPVTATMKPVFGRRLLVEGKT